MKKEILVLISLFIMMPVVSLAASTILFNPANGSYQSGQVFKVQILVNPQGSKIYTVKAEIKYPANMLEVQSFQFSDKWMPLVQPGYDVVDNSKGVLIKTGGYPGGFDSVETLGTITFKAKDVGTASLSFGSNSMTLDDLGANSLSLASAKAIFNLTAPPPVVKKNKTTTVKKTENNAKNTVVSEKKIVEKLPEKIKQTKIPTGKKFNFLAVAALSTLAYLNPVVLLVIALISLILAFVYIRKNFRDNKSKLRKRIKK